MIKSPHDRHYLLKLINIRSACSLQLAHRTTQILATTNKNPALSAEVVTRIDASVQKLIELKTESRRLHSDIPAGQQVATKDDIDHDMRSIVLAQDKDGLRLLTRYVQMVLDKLNSSVFYCIGALLASVAAVVAVFWRT